LSLFDLPLGDGTVWSIGEEQADTTAPGGREEQVVSVLPAWSARTDLELAGDEALGFTAAARVLAGALELAEWRYDARQAAMARYSAVGFEAAAVTGLAVPPVRQGVPSGPMPNGHRAVRPSLCRGRRRL
jgi:hypothetical protein